MMWGRIAKTLLAAGNFSMSEIFVTGIVKALRGATLDRKLASQTAFSTASSLTFRLPPINRLNLPEEERDQESPTGQTGSMFVCRACLRKSVSAAAAETRLLLRTRTAPATFGVAQRAFASVSTAQKTPVTDRSESGPAEQEGPASATDGDIEVSKEKTKKLEWVVNKHLQYLKDPLQIGEHVKQTLEKGRFDEALLLTRKASRDTAVTVSWNYLIDFQMKEQRLHAAVKLYNEMKKRAQLPNAQTYTIIFRGCAKSIHPKLAVSEAVRIYNSMLINPRLKPNTIHLNAVLDTCSRAHDMDSLFTILQTVDERVRAPDNQTFTIVLNALQHKPDASPRSVLSQEDIKRISRASIDRAKAIWADVAERWKNGRLVVDEELVCAMGRALSYGGQEDKTAVLELLEQTMQLPRFDLNPDVSALAHPKSESEPGVTPSTDPVSKELEERSSPSPKSPVKTDGLRYPKPGRNTLSLIMTCLHKKTTLAPKYWDYLTQVHGVVPDSDNYTKYLQVLQIGRASTKTAQVVSSMPKEYLKNYIFRMAFSTCVYDELNQHAFANACRIFDTMVAKNRYVDPLATRLFLRSARGNTRHIYEKYKDDPDSAKTALGKQICAAVDRLWDPLRILTSSFSFPGRPTLSPQHQLELTENDMMEAMSTVRRVIAALDKVSTEELAPPNVIKLLKQRRTILQMQLERQIAKMVETEKGREKKVLGEKGKRRRPKNEGNRPRRV